MTKKDYVLIANAIRAAHGETGSHVVIRTAEHIAEALRGSNPLFDTSKFMAAVRDPKVPAFYPVTDQNGKRILVTIPETK